MALLDFSSFILGLLTPLTAVCVLPLYPAFLAYIANQFSEKENRKTYALFGAIITLGVIAFMLLLGIIFTTLFQVSLTKVIGVISPIAFSILAIISLLLIFDFDVSRFIPKPKTPTSKNPKINAFLYGFFFGAIVIPCNPAFVAAFFARALIFENFFPSMINFLLFGLGLGFPLLIFSLVSSKWSEKIIRFATKYKSVINRIAGVIMLFISGYYLICVFNIFGKNLITNRLCKLYNWLFYNFEWILIFFVIFILVLIIISLVKKSKGNIK